MLPKTPIQTIGSETAIWIDIAENFKIYRTLNHTALYLGGGADHYNHPDNTFCIKTYDYPKIAELIADVLPKNPALKTAIVSLGCGSCEKDRRILEQLQASGHNVSLFGADSSMAMLQQAEKVLEGATFDTHLLFADFRQNAFKKALGTLTNSYDLRIYLFMGNTTGSFHQGYILGLVNHMMHKGDYLLVDIPCSSKIEFQIEDKLKGWHTDTLKPSPELDFLLHPFRILGVQEDCGRLILGEAEDPPTGAQVFTFGFRMHTTFSFTLRKRQTTLNQNEYIKLFHILIYNLKKFTTFMKALGFTFKDKVTGELTNQLLFQK